MLKELEKNEKPYISTREIYTRIASIIANDSEQQPMCRPVRNTGDKGGEFVFVSKQVATGKKEVERKSLTEATEGTDDEIELETKRLNAEKKELAKAKLARERKNLEEEKSRLAALKAEDEAQDKSADENKKLEAEEHRLEKERAALAKQKALDEKRQKIAEEKERLAAEKEAARQAALERKQAKKATMPRPSVSTANEIERDGRFIAYSNGTVLDTNTNLMLAAKDNGSKINWQGAKSYCENYRGGGYSDWRMPTQDELAGLYDKSKGYSLC